MTDEQARVFRKLGEPAYVEIFTWVEGAFGRTHEHPDVLAIWELMDPLREERDGKLKWEFPHYAAIDLSA